ncbi:general vesicular transport factor p115-like [Brevipalpus obovatus]|uniref:general vesicular transport factor p115-like n=1 Tax=Brevipalpus obovatus TaxID=246614 RepID=UPI003D9EC61A
MDSFRNVFGALSNILGEPDEGDRVTVHDEIQKVINRLEISTLLEDRRENVKKLRELCERHRKEVGSLAMDVLVQTLKNDRGDSEIVEDLLAILHHIISGESYETESGQLIGHDALGTIFTEVFIKKDENLQVIFDMIKDKDYLDSRFRGDALKLFMTFARIKPREVQEFVFNTDMGIPTLFDLLEDFRDHIRLDAISLLKYLASNNAKIQTPIAAHENAFARLINMLEVEGYPAGGVIVGDCLMLLFNLLRNNDLTQKSFKDHIKSFSALIKSTDWGIENISNTKTNLILTLHIIRLLVSPSNLDNLARSCQDAIKSSGILTKLCEAFFEKPHPGIIQEMLNAIGEIIRGNSENQKFFKSIFDERSSSPLVVCLLDLMVSSKNLLQLRCSALYCFQCLVYRNEEIQEMIIDSLLKSQNDLCELISESFRSIQPLTHWFLCNFLSHAIMDNPAQKVNLLKVSLFKDEEGNPKPLMEQCFMMIRNFPKHQSQIGFIMFLSSWMYDCPPAVREFIKLDPRKNFIHSEFASRGGDDTEIVVQGLCAYLLGLCFLFNDGSVEHNSKNDILALIKRVGAELFCQKLRLILESDFYSHAVSKPQIRIFEEEQLIFDYDFCKKVQKLTDLMVKIVQNEPDPQSQVSELTEKVKQKDDEISHLKNEVETLKSEIERYTKENQDLTSAYQQISDQLAIFKAQSYVAQNPHPVSIQMPQHYGQYHPINPDQYRQPTYHQPMYQDPRCVSSDYRNPHYHDGNYHN